MIYLKPKNAKWKIIGKNFNAILQLFQFHNTQEMKLPTYNTRIKFPQSQKDNMYDGKSRWMDYFKLLV